MKAIFLVQRFSWLCLGVDLADVTFVIGTVVCNCWHFIVTIHESILSNTIRIQDIIFFFEISVHRFEWLWGGLKKHIAFCFLIWHGEVSVLYVLCLLFFSRFLIFLTRRKTGLLNLTNLSMHLPFSIRRPLWRTKSIVSYWPHN